MKKGLIIFLFLLTVTILVGCKEKEIKDNDENIIIDNTKPLIVLPTENFILEVNQNTKINLKEMLIEKGVTAIDDVDGNITDSIEIGYNDFDITTVGDYYLDVFVYDKARNKSEVKFIKVKVKEHYPFLDNYPVYLDEIVNENKHIEKQPLFDGAWYYKSITSFDSWLGIEGTIILPEIELRRYNGSYNEELLVDPLTKSLDNPSIYFGGKSAYESDVGLSLSLGLYNNNGNNIISTGSFVFRPFWRYITSVNEPNKDLGSYDLDNGRRYSVSSTNSNNTNMFANWYYGDTEHYYLPGDKLRMIVYSPKANFLQLQIEVIEKSTLEQSVKLRKDNGWKDPANFISPLFTSQGHGSINAEFKRVNALDQSANEGKPAIMTNSNVREAIWESVYLHRKIDDKMYRVPFNNERMDTLAAPDANYFTASEVNDTTGGFSITIHPHYKK